MLALCNTRDETMNKGTTKQVVITIASNIITFSFFEVFWQDLLIYRQKTMTL